jgi:hypothetical protein
MQSKNVVCLLGYERGFSMNPLGEGVCCGACMPSSFVADWNMSSLSMQKRMEHTDCGAVSGRWYCNCTHIVHHLPRSVTHPACFHLWPMHCC